MGYGTSFGTRCSLYFIEKLSIKGGALKMARQAISLEK